MSRAFSTKVRMRLCVGIAVSSCLLAHIAGGAAAVAAERPSMAVIFDSTNSMWGQIDGTNKVVLLRKALGRFFEATAGKVDMGLLTYGTNDEAVCSAINKVLPLGPVVPDDYSRAVDQTSPGSGGTPIAQALIDAAVLAAYERRRATLVVISDGLDNCRTDPCATAARLKAASPGLTIHVVGFDSAKKERLAALSCMAKKTGGIFFSATNGAELDTALGAIHALATDTKAPFQVWAPKPKETSVLATGSQGSEAPVSDISSSVTPLEIPATGSTPQARETEPSATGQSEPQLTKADPRADSEPTVMLRLSASLVDNDPPLANGLVWRVFPARPDQNGEINIVATNTNAKPEFLLHAGDYVIHVGYGRAKAIKKITATKGVINESLVLNAGGLRLNAVRSGGGEIPPNSVSYAVFSSEQDQFGQRKLILPSAPTGKVIRLNAGSYRIVSQFGDANAVVRADVQVEPNKLSDVVVSHEAAKVTLKLVREPGGEALADTSWSVRTLDDEVVAQSVGAFPTHILAAGDYTIVALNEGIAYSRKYTVALGYDQEVEIIGGSGDDKETQPPAPQ